MDTPISRLEFNEYSKRIDAENSRQNQRLKELEQTIREISELTASVQKLALNMENMLKAQNQQGDRLDKLEQKQGERLDKLEQKPANMWNSMTRTIFTTVVSSVSGGLAVGIVMMIAQNMK